nr:hypothetical protein [Mycoplasmopsis synoviae]
MNTVTKSDHNWETWKSIPGVDNYVNFYNALNPSSKVFDRNN